MASSSSSVPSLWQLVLEKAPDTPPAKPDTNNFSTAATFITAFQAAASKTGVCYVMISPLASRAEIDSLVNWFLGNMQKWPLYGFSAIVPEPDIAPQGQLTRADLLVWMYKLRAALAGSLYSESYAGVHGLITIMSVDTPAKIAFDAAKAAKKLEQPSLKGSSHV